jgi:hypothetical protein
MGFGVGVGEIDHALCGRADEEAGTVLDCCGQFNQVMIVCKTRLQLAGVRIGVEIF